MSSIAALSNYPLYTGNTSGFYLIANDSGETTTYKVQTETLNSEFTYRKDYTASLTWSVNHNLNSDFPLVTCWSSDRKIVIPSDVISIDNNNIEVHFPLPVAGTISVGKVS